MSTTQRGAVIFVILLIALFACVTISFSVLPNSGIAVGLPVITVPGEAYNGELPSENINFTNTLMAMLLADVAVVIFAILAWRASKGWTREVPTRFQSWVELLGDFMYGQTKGFAGTRELARRWLFPLAASIFVFLLAANWMKLLPGIESVGVLHCAHAGFSGYPTVQVGPGAYQLHIDQALYAGVRASEDDYHNCEHYKENPELKPSKEALETAAADLEVREAALIEELETEGIENPAADPRVESLRREVTESLYEHSTFSLSAADLRQGLIPYVQVVTPYVRGATTDLNLTLGLALITFFAIQIFGVAAQGPAYFMKFINLNALGSLQKKPLGAVDFLVGIFEIVSEIGKIISLAFRLFGNMFAGGILLAVMSFLVATLLPMIFIGLEVIVTTIQAYVFAVLTIVFSAQAMEGHHSDDEHHAEDHGGHAAEELEGHEQPITRTAI
jgi:F-type H+-transporting ATPase subunit a